MNISGLLPVYVVCIFFSYNAVFCFFACVVYCKIGIKGTSGLFLYLASKGLELLVFYLRHHGFLFTSCSSATVDLVIPLVLPATFSRFCLGVPEYLLGCW